MRKTLPASGGKKIAAQAATGILVEGSAAALSGELTGTDLFYALFDGVIGGLTYGSKNNFFEAAATIAQTLLDMFEPRVM